MVFDRSWETAGLGEVCSVDDDKRRPARSVASVIRLFARCQVAGSLSPTMTNAGVLDSLRGSLLRRRKRSGARGVPRVHASLETASFGPVCSPSSKLKIHVSNFCDVEVLLD